MIYRKILITSIILGFLALIFVLLNDNNKKNLSFQSLSVATCPTFLESLENFWKDKGAVASTNNTAESLQLLSKNEVDFVISGRPLKPGEGEFEHFFINRSGYSFVGTFEANLYLSDLKNLPIYTDLDIDQIKKDLDLNNLIFIDNIYNRPQPSLAITSWENTDYSRAQIVHILNLDGSRHPLSRTPILYCNKCAQEVVSMFKNF